MQKNLTTGSVFKNIVIFSLPFLLSYFLQTLYGLADLFIVGQYNGADIISAVSIGSQVMHMLTVIIVGLAMGAAGAAWGTVLAQTSSVIFALITIRKRESSMKLSKSGLVPDKQMLGELLKIGVFIWLQRKHKNNEAQ